MREHMHAVVQQAFGGPEVLEVAEVDRPVPLGTEVLVRVQAVGVNPVEPLIRSGQFPLIGPPPFIRLGPKDGETAVTATQVREVPNSPAPGSATECPHLRGLQDPAPSRHWNT